MAIILYSKVVLGGCRRNIIVLVWNHIGRKCNIPLPLNNEYNAFRIILYNGYNYRNLISML